MFLSYVTIVMVNLGVLKGPFLSSLLATLPQIYKRFGQLIFYGQNKKYESERGNLFCLDIKRNSLVFLHKKAKVSYFYRQERTQKACFSILNHTYTARNTTQAVLRDKNSATIKSKFKIVIQNSWHNRLLQSNQDRYLVDQLSPFI